MLDVDTWHAHAIPMHTFWANYVHVTTTQVVVLNVHTSYYHTYIHTYICTYLVKNKEFVPGWVESLRRRGKIISTQTHLEY